MSFGDDIRKYAEKQKRNLDEVVVESLIDLSASVIIKTPVKEGITVGDLQPPRPLRPTSLSPVPTRKWQQSKVGYFLL